MEEIPNLFSSDYALLNIFATYSFCADRLCFVYLIQHSIVETEPLPVTAVTAVALDHSNVEVNWTPDERSHQDSYQLRYHDDTKDTTWSRVDSLTVKTKTVIGLFPGDQYTFEVKAVSYNQTSTVNTITAVLCKSPYCNNSHF